MSVIYKNGTYYGAGGGGGSSDTEIIADDFDPTESYAVGEYVVYEGTLYKCTTAHTGAWDASDFDDTQVMAEMPTPMPSTDMSDIVSPLPGVMSRRRIYSPDEQVIGEWREYVDGVLKKKPVYEKTIYKASISSAQETIDSFSNKVLINSKGTFTDNSSHTYNIGYCDPSGYNAYLIVINDILRLDKNKFGALTDIRLTFQYTKTTDEWEVV